MQGRTTTRRGRHWALVLTGLAFVSAQGLLGCTGQPVSSSAQAGSTVILTFGVSDDPTLLPLSEVAYGGTDFVDSQRGQLVVHLGDATGPALTTRFATLAAPPVEASSGPSAGILGQQLLLVVDIPVDAPLGTHSLVLVREREVGGVLEETLVTPSPSTLSILPNEVTFEVEGGGTETAVGSPSPSAPWLNGFVSILPGTFLGGPEGGFRWIIPEPSFGVKLTADVPAGAGSGSRFIGYAQLEIEYPDAAIDVQRVVATDPATNLVSWSDDGAGVVLVELVTSAPGPGSTTGVSPIRVVFALDDPTQPVLNLAGFDADIVAATDQYGEPGIVSDWNLDSIVTAIR